MPRYRVKIVPQDEPNAPGRWITWKLPEHVARRLFSARTPGALNVDYAPKGFVIVAHRRPYRRKARPRIVAILRLSASFREFAKAMELAQQRLEAYQMAAMRALILPERLLKSRPLRLSPLFTHPYGKDSSP